MNYEKLRTVKGIKGYFRQYKRVRNVKIINDGFGFVSIYVKSWLPLSKKQYRVLKENKPASIILKIYNKYLFGKSNKEI